MAFQIDAHVDTLVSEQAAFILNRTNLTELYSAVQQHQPKLGPFSSLQGMDSISVKSAMVITSKTLTGTHEELHS